MHVPRSRPPLPSSVSSSPHVSFPFIFPDTLSVFLFWIPLTFHDPLSEPFSTCSAIPNPFPIPLSDPITQSRFLFPFCIPVSRSSPTIQFPASVPWSNSTMLFPNPVLCLPSPIPLPDGVHRSCPRTPRWSHCPFPVPIPFSFPRPPVRPLWTMT